MKPFSYFFCLIMISSAVSAQNIDSLEKLSSAAMKAGNLEYAAYYDAYLGHLCSEQKRYDEAFSFFSRVVANRNKIRSLSSLGTALDGLGGIYSYKGFPDSSIYYYQEAMTAFTADKDTAQLLRVQANLAVEYRNLGMYDEAFATSFQAISLLEKQKPGRTLASFYNTIGSTYLRISEFGKAREYYHRSLVIRKQLGQPVLIAHSYNNIAESYIRESNYDSALIFLSKSAELKRDNGDLASLAETLSNTGLAHLKRKEFQQAEKVLREALALQQKNDDRIGQAVTLNRLGEVFLGEDNLEKAYEALNRAESIVREVGSLENLNENLTLKIRLHRARNEFPVAFEYAEELRSITDSLFAREKVRSMIAADVKYQSGIKDRTIGIITEREKLTRASLEVRKAQVRILALGTVSLMIITALVLYNRRTIKKSKAKVELLLRELHHRVKNNLQMLSSILSLQTHQLTDQKAVEAARSNETRVNAMALIHRKLYQTDETTGIDCQEYIRDLVNYLVQTYGYANKNIRVDLQVDAVTLDADKLVPIGLIINELLSNSFKHAFADNPQPGLFVSLQLKEDNIRIEVRDNGGGIIGQGNGQGFGMKMIRSLTRQLHGTLDITREQGSRFVLNIPQKR